MDRIGLICRSIYENPKVTQRDLAAAMDISLGSANRLYHECLDRGFFREEASGLFLTDAGKAYLEPFRVDGAVIQAAGFGSRFVPLTFETPKGLLEVLGERMIERQIRQLHEAGITDITIVVGYLKEKFEYLIDKYQVKLLYNPEYSYKNNLSTFYAARELFRGRNMYLLVSDNWLRDNMYHRYECGAWYSSVYMEGKTTEWCLSFNKKGRITEVNVGGRDSWAMYGPAYFSREFSDAFIPMAEKAYHTPGTESFFWEQVLMDNIRGLDIYVNRQPAGQVYEFENLEELREFDSRYRDHSDNDALALVSRVFEIPESKIRNLRCLKSGMTNQSFLFDVDGKSYICRIPGPGTDRLINRADEAENYRANASLGICEKIIFFDGASGYKIAKFYEGSRNADARNPEDLKKCMILLRKLHRSGLTVNHRFDLRERIDFYESLCRGRERMLFEDYREVREKMNTLLEYTEKRPHAECFCHIDPCADNFLMLPDGTARLIDWEYASMQDPLLDIAMSSIYSYYTEEEMIRLLTIYLEREPSGDEIRVVWAYMALSGFLWALWSVFKSISGVEFGDYIIRMYHYAKEGWRKVSDSIL